MMIKVCQLTCYLLWQNLYKAMKIYRWNFWKCPGSPTPKFLIQSAWDCTGTVRSVLIIRGVPFRGSGLMDDWKSGLEVAAEVMGGIGHCLHMGTETISIYVGCSVGRPTSPPKWFHCDIWSGKNVGCLVINFYGWNCGLLCVQSPKFGRA